MQLVIITKLKIKDCDVNHKLAYLMQVKDKEMTSICMNGAYSSHTIERRMHQYRNHLSIDL